MSSRPRRTHALAYQSKVALAAINGEQTMAALAQRFAGHPHPITQWATLLLQRARSVVEGGESPQTPLDVKTLPAHIGEWTWENDFFETARTQAGRLSARR